MREAPCARAPHADQSIARAYIYIAISQFSGADIIYIHWDYFLATLLPSSLSS